METYQEKVNLENLSISDIDSLSIVEVEKILSQIDSNTKWDDTSKHITHNGAKMRC